MNMIDARGLSCPMPVLMVQKEVKAKSPAKLEVCVDTQTALQNITRFAKANGYSVAVEEKEDEEYLMTLTK